jgi:hypothetical protein
MKDFGLYAVLAALVFAVAVFITFDEAGVPDHGDSPWPDIEVRGLDVPEGEGGRAAFQAKTATPRSTGGVITLGGWREGVDLRGVRVDLAPGVVLQGDTGTFVDGRLTVSGRVFVRRDGRRCLDADRVAMFDDRVKFAGLVVLHPPSGRSTAMDLGVTRAELLESLR